MSPNDEIERLSRSLKSLEPIRLHEEISRVTELSRLASTRIADRGGANGENPHAHLMFSERGHDGIERDSLLGRCFRATTTSCGYLSQMDTPLRANLYAKPFASHPRSYHLLADSGRSIVF